MATGERRYARLLKDSESNVKEYLEKVVANQKAKRSWLQSLLKSLRQESTQAEKELKLLLYQKTLIVDLNQKRSLPQKGPLKDVQEKTNPVTLSPPGLLQRTITKIKAIF